MKRQRYILTALLSFYIIKYILNNPTSTEVNFIAKWFPTCQAKCPLVTPLPPWWWTCRCSSKCTRWVCRPWWCSKCALPWGWCTLPRCSNRTDRYPTPKLCSKSSSTTCTLDRDRSIMAETNKTSSSARLEWTNFLVFTSVVFLRRASSILTSSSFSSQEDSKSRMPRLLLTLRLTSLVAMDIFNLYKEKKPNVASMKWTTQR